MIKSKDQEKQNFTKHRPRFKNSTTKPIPKLKIKSQQPKETKFSDFYQPSEKQKQGELLFIDTNAPLHSGTLSLNSF